MMNWIQQNKRLSLIFGIMIAGGLGLGYWIYVAWSDFSSAQSEWESKSQKTTAMENSKVYPSPANVKALDREIADYRSEYKLLRTALLDPAAQRPIKPMSETEFQAKVKERARALNQKADEFGVKRPANFTLGFEEYSGKLPLNAEASAELNIHLDVMEMFITTLIGARVISIDQLQRYRLACEDKKSTGTAPVAPQKNAAPSAPVANTEQVLDRYTIKCNFTTDQKQLETVMNNLSNAATTHDFLTVRLMRVDNERADAPTKEEIRAIQRNNITSEAPAPSGSVDPKAPASNAIVPPKPLPADSWTIIGAENLKVYLEVDYIRFRQPTPENTAVPKR